MVKQTVMIDLREPKYQTVFGHLPAAVRGRLVDHETVGVLLVVWNGDPYTLVVEGGWLELVIDAAAVDRSSIEGLILPPSIVIVAVANWPQMWASMDWQAPETAELDDGLFVVRAG